MENPNGTTNRSIRIPNDLDRALTTVCEARGVTRTQYLLAVLRHTLEDEGVIQTQKIVARTYDNKESGVIQRNANVAREEFDDLVKRVEVLEQKGKNSARRKVPAPKEARPKGSTWSRKRGLYEYNGVEATLNEHLAPIKDAHGKEALAKAKQAVHSSRRRGNTDDNAIRRTLQNYDCV